MQISELKNQIENKSLNRNFFVFRYHDTDFVAIQYCYEIAKILGLTVVFSNDISNCYSPFYSKDAESFDIFKEESFNDDPIENCAVITKETEFADAIDIPRLEKWQLEDFVRTSISNESVVKCILDACGDDIYAIDSELSKFRIFSDVEKNIVINQMIDENQFDFNSGSTVFDLINGIDTKDASKIKKSYEYLKSTDINVFGFISLLYNNIKNIINIQLYKNSTPQLCNIPEKQFYAIKKNCGYYTKIQLANMFEFISSKDYKIKSGNLQVENLFDYIIISLLEIANE